MNQLISWFDFIFVCFIFFVIWFVPSWRCLINTLLTHCTHTFFQRISHVHEQPWSPIVWWFFGSSFMSYYVHFFSEVKTFRLCFFSVPFLLVFVFYFLVPFVGIFSQNMGCLIKIPLKHYHCTQTIFQGGSPWATRSPIVWLLCGSSIVSSIEFPSGSLAISMGFLSGSYGMFMLFRLDFYDISLSLLWNLNKFSMGFPWNFYGIFGGVPMGLLWHPYSISMMFLWCVLWDYYGVHIGFPWYSIGFLWYYCGI